MQEKYQLEQHYLGDEAWEAFVAALPASDEQCPAEVIEALDGQVDIGKAAFFHVGKLALSWVHRPVPALDGRSPAECAREPKLIARLRSMLMRMP